jgi:hypothetical protein
LTPEVGSLILPSARSAAYHLTSLYRLPVQVKVELRSESSGNRMPHELLVARGREIPREFVPNRMLSVTFFRKGFKMNS